MEVVTSENAVHLRPKLRWKPGKLDRVTGKRSRGERIGRYTDPTILLRTGEVISRSERYNRIRAVKRFAASFGQYAANVARIWANRLDLGEVESHKERGKVETFSFQSARRLRFASYSVNFDYMLTLTFASIPSPEYAKQCLNRYLTWLRSVGVKSYLWVAELQKRGAIHFHLILPEGPYCALLRQRVAFFVDGVKYLRPLACVAWGRCIDSPCRVWLSCGSWERVRVVENARRYLGKYLSKTSEGAGTFSGRKWGTHRFKKQVYANSRIVRAIFRSQSWKLKDTIWGCSAHVDTVTRIIARFKQSEQEDEQEVRNLGHARHSGSVGGKKVRDYVPYRTVGA